MFLFREQTIYSRAKLISHYEEDIVDDYKLKEDKDMIKNIFRIKKAEIGDALLMLAFLLLMVYCILPMIWMVI